MGEIYQIFGSDAAQMAYQLLERMGLNLNSKLKVGIKPNLVLAKPSISGATTDPQLVAGVIKYLQHQGVKEIVLLEGAWVGAETKQAVKVCGYEQLMAEYGIQFYDLKEDQFTKCYSGDLEIKVCRRPLEVDFLINLPVLKAHCQTKLTCALKNLKGCIPDSEKRRFHSLGLHQPIAHLNKILKSDLIIVDGIIGDLTFEEGGNPVQMNRVLAGSDPVLIDSYVTQLLGYQIEEVPYISIADRLGVGSSDLTKAEVINLNQTTTGDKLELTIGADKVEALYQYITEKEACSACVGSLIHALQRISESSGIPQDLELFIGQGFKGKSLAGIGVGSCTNNCENNIGGCPPTAREIVDRLKQLW
ncbi:DUF362 domain-containing protein [Natroniella acetigena]|uniref:DUF362 domain-containing protein n=1 Tax=Natroniella acetigena TaxID=52004 RepID=UPI00200A6FA6|nr:DUF362 domain-containing protein [Natroniella acetigena]MCK8826345.1 DUF362 domain-containing protein [Natroniella acetigena]